MALITYGHMRIPIERIEGGVLRPVAGAQVYVYKDRADGTPSIDSAGNVLASAILASLFSGPLLTSPAIIQPLTTDSEGYLDCYADNDEYHYRVVLADGSVFGQIGLPFSSPRARY